MRTFKLILSILLIGGVILWVAVSLVFMKSFNVNRYRPQIIKLASQTLGRPVDIGSLKLQLTLTEGVAIEVQGLKVADLPQFQSEPLLTIDSLQMSVDIMRWFMRQGIRISRVRVQSPQIVLIKDKNGAFNVQSLGTAPAAENPQAPPKPATEGAKNEPAPAAAKPVEIPPFTVGLIAVEDGRIVYMDQGLSPAGYFHVPVFSLTANNFSLKDAFVVKGAGMLGPLNNVRWGGAMKIDLDRQNATLSNFTCDADLSGLPLAEIKKGFEALMKNVSFPEEIKGKLKVRVTQAVAGAKGLESLDMNGELSEGLLRLHDLAAPVQSIQAKFSADTARAQISELSATLASGNITGKAGISNYLRRPDVSVETAMAGVELSQLIDQSRQPVRADGKLLGQLQLKGTGVAPEDLQKSLVGQAHWEIKDGKLVDINILKTVFDKMSMLPGLVNKLQTALPERYKQMLRQKDTILQQVTMDGVISGGAFQLNEMTVSAEGFELSGGGSVGFDQSLRLGFILGLEPELSKGMVEAVPELRFIMEDDGRIQMPVTVSGKATSPAVIPNLEYLGKRIMLNTGREQLDKVLDKVFGDSSGTSAPQGNAPAPQPQEKPPERKAIESILNSIFK